MRNVCSHHSQRSKSLYVFRSFALSPGISYTSEEEERGARLAVAGRAAAEGRESPEVALRAVGDVMTAERLGREVGEWRDAVLRNLQLLRGGDHQLKDLKLSRGTMGSPEGKGAMHSRPHLVMPTQDRKQAQILKQVRCLCGMVAWWHGGMVAWWHGGMVAHHLAR